MKENLVENYWEAVCELEAGAFQRSVFLAGAITGAENWQVGVARALLDVPDAGINVWNPRRKDFPIGDPGAAEEQITWEFEALRRCESVLIWFTPPTLCPICLYELGKCSMTHEALFVGVHPEYARRQDVEIQTRLLRPHVRVVHDLDELTEQVLRYWRRISRA
mgnify:CR=1 FL=1